MFTQELHECLLEIKQEIKVSSWLSIASRDGERDITLTPYWMEMLEVVHGRAAGQLHPWLQGTESLAVNQGGTLEPHALHLSGK
jgi:hypothetical protein